VGGPPEEVDSLLEGETSFPCVTPLCGGRLFKTNIAACVDRSVKAVTLREFFRGIHGFGTGRDGGTTIERARALLKSKPIADVVGFSVGDPARVIVQQIILKDGTRLHFDTSAKGACLYYVEEPGPSCVEVFDESNVSNSVHVHAGVESSGSYREEDRRVPTFDVEGNRDRTGSVAGASATTE
jgi:hypothetical protein